LIEDNLRNLCPWVYDVPPLLAEESIHIVKDSVFGEVESGW
jgi:hypothetical protein